MTSHQSSKGAPTLTIHRAAEEIGGNCIEIEYDGYRLLLDAGSPLDGVPGAEECPATLDTTRPVAGVVVSHPHQDHYGLLKALPASWAVWCGRPTETLMRLTLGLSGTSLSQPVNTYQNGVPIAVGPFEITPFLTDHSAFDAHMLLVRVGGKTIFYSGDFRRTGRKSSLVSRMIAAPPKDVDILLLEGTALGRDEAFPTESELEERFVEHFRSTSGRVFVTWSAQNIDRTVTIFRACKKAHRMLVLDLYTVDVLEQLGVFSNQLPRLGWPGIKAVVTSSLNRHYNDEKRFNRPEFVERVARSGNAMGAAKIQEGSRDTVVMLRPSLYRDYVRKGLVLEGGDSWVFSMWSAYLKEPEYQDLQEEFGVHGVGPFLIHTSGHAGKQDLVAFADSVKAGTVVGIHGECWGDHLGEFRAFRSMVNGEPLVIT